MSTDLVRPDALTAEHAEAGMAALAHVLGTGDLYQLSNAQRVGHYLSLCQDVGLVPRTRPYQWIEFKETADSPPVLTLYLKPTGAAQILRNNHVSVSYPTREIVGELFKVEAHGICPDGREGWATKYVPLTNKYGRLGSRQLANAYMAAETGALRRLALAMFGAAGGPDQGDVVGWRPVVVDGRGAVLEHPTDEQRALAADPGMAAVIGEPTFEDAGPTEQSPGPETANLGPRADELERPTRTVPKPSLRPSAEDVKRLLGAWFGAVKGSSLDDDDERHRFVRQYTAGYPKGLQTDSLKAFLESATERQAGDLLAHVRALVADEKRAILEADITNAAEEPF
ncbi:MAG: hypothetical protein ACJ77I_06825 [Chloroflexota bacterium]